MNRSIFNLQKLFKYLLTLIVYILLLNYTLWLFTPLYIFWLVFWLFKLVLYLLFPSKKIIAPQKIPHNTKWFSINEHWVYYLYALIVIKPYLSAYASVYFVLSMRVSKISFLHIAVAMLFKIITGLSWSLLKKSLKYAKKIILILEFDAISIRAYVSTIFFNLNAYEFDEILFFEKLKIYKTKDKLFNFNPDFEKLKLIFKTLFPRLDVNACKKINSNDKIIKIITNLRDYIESEAIKGTLSVKGSKVKHYGAYYKATPVEGFVVNYTSKEKLKVLDSESSEISYKKNFALSNTSYITKPIISTTTKLNLEESKLEDQDPRLLYEELNPRSVLFVLTLASKQDEYFAIDDSGVLVSRKIENPTTYLQDMRSFFENTKIAKPLKVWYDIEWDVTELQKYLVIGDFKGGDALINYLIAAFNDLTIEQKFYNFAVKKIEQDF